MPVIGGSAKKKDHIPSQKVIAQKRFVSTARVQLSTVDSPYPVFYIMMINLTTLMKSSLIAEHNFIQLIVFFFHIGNPFHHQIQSVFRHQGSKPVPIVSCMACNAVVPS